MEVRVIEQIQRIGSGLDQVPKPKVIVWIGDKLPANQAPPITRLCALLRLFEARLGLSRQRMGSKNIRMYYRVAESVQWISLVSHKWREGDSVLPVVDRLTTDRTFHSTNKDSHQFGPKRMI
jgi:hypothetical protein